MRSRFLLAITSVFVLALAVGQANAGLFSRFQERRQARWEARTAQQSPNVVATPQAKAGATPAPVPTPAPTLKTGCWVQNRDGNLVWMPNCENPPTSGVGTPPEQSCANGACSNGSCGTGRVGLFGRRR